MGRSKALLDADGRPFVRRVVETLVAGGAAPVVVVVRDADGAEAEAARAAGATVAVNPEPDHPRRGGLASSLRVGLEGLPDDVAGVLVHPVDHPRVQTATVRALIDDFRREGAPVTEPVFDGRTGHPVLLHADLFPELLEPDLTQGPRTVVHRYAALRRKVAVSDEGVLDDVDTPTDYRRAFPGRTVDPADAAALVLEAMDAGRRVVVVLRPGVGGDAAARRVAVEVFDDADGAVLDVHGSLGDADLDGTADRMATAVLDGSEQEGLHDGLYAELHVPRPDLVIVGAGHIAQPLCTVGALLGFRVRILDDRPEFATDERFPEADEILRVDFQDPFADLSIRPLTHLVLVTRGHRYDFECLRRILLQPVRPRYVGMIGSRRRVRATWAALLDEGIPRARLAEIRAPVGLDLGAETPAEIAVSVAAELVLAWRGGSGRPLRDVERVLERFFEPTHQEDPA